METVDRRVDSTDPFVDHEAYRAGLAFCESPGVTFHSSSIDPDSLEKLASAGSCMIVDGVPLTIGVTDAHELIDEERCLRLAQAVNPDADGHNIKAALLPAPFLLSKIDDIRTAASGTQQYIFAEYDEGAPGTEILGEGADKGFVVHSLTHEGTQTEAGLNLYEAVTKSKAEYAMPILKLPDVVDLQTIQTHEERPDGSALDLKRGGQFTESEMESMWDLFSQRFQDISDNSPVRLEESKENTFELFSNPEYVFSYDTSADGNIICAAFATEDRDSYPWVSPEFLDIADSKIEEQTGRKPYGVFVPGVAAYKEQGMGASRNVLQRLTDCIAATGNHDIVFRFECTDVSSLYVPRIVTSVLKHNQYVEFINARQLGQKKYVLIEVEAA